MSDECKAKRDEILREKKNAIKAAEETAKTKLDELNIECKNTKTVGKVSATTPAETQRFYTNTYVNSGGNRAGFTKTRVFGE